MLTLAQFYCSSVEIHTSSLIQDMQKTNFPEITVKQKNKMVLKSAGTSTYCPSNMPWRPIGLRAVEAPTFPKRSLTDGSEVVGLMHLPPFTPRKIPDTHFF
jgi:hypothetical protein